MVRCTLDEGSIGWGEGLPREYVTGETIDTVLTQIRDTDWRSQLGGTFGNLSEAIAVCDQIQPLPRPRTSGTALAIRSGVRWS